MGAWSYESTPVDGGTRVSAAVTSMLRVYLDESGAKFVRLVFRDDPVWGYDAHLALESGDFDCPTGCSVEIAVDGGPQRTVLASRPEASAPVLSLREPRQLWYALRDAQLLTVDFPARGKGTQRATFDVSGLDRSRLDWDQQPYAKDFGVTA
ncbi:hypothetical protein [Luteimonas aquatica]|uniref:hypothetical protein n=1 Tax=Luteimonas aquatica TaxID=450364 RepID=UPI001F59B571|nr:hypothetical protein [Luteimonas aquatica]